MKKSLFSAVAVYCLRRVVTAADAPQPPGRFCGSAGSSAASPAGAPVALFNGKDLTGWVQVLDSKWTVENGVLPRSKIRRAARGRELAHHREGLHRLRSHAEVPRHAGGNSGVFMRDPIPRATRLAAADGGQGPWEAGLEANIQADNPEWPTGSIIRSDIAQ